MPFGQSQGISQAISDLARIPTTTIRFPRAESAGQPVRDQNSAATVTAISAVPAHPKKVSATLAIALITPANTQAAEPAGAIIGQGQEAQQEPHQETQDRPRTTRWTRMRRYIERSSDAGTIVATPILSGLHHWYARI
jgi:hypothetical protein